MNQPLALHSLHESWGAAFALVNGSEVVESYGNWQTEHSALIESVGLVDLCFRGRLCLLGKDRQAFLNGQVTSANQIGNQAVVLSHLDQLAVGVVVDPAVSHIDYG